MTQTVVHSLLLIEILLISDFLYLLLYYIISSHLPFAAVMGLPYCLHGNLFSRFLHIFVSASLGLYFIINTTSIFNIIKLLLLLSL